MAKSPQASNADQAPGLTVEDSVAPVLVIEDAVPEVKEPAKPVTVTELPNGVVIEDY